MNGRSIVYSSLDIICTCWGLRRSKWTFGRNAVRVQYPVVIWAIKACLITWEHRVLFLESFERKSGAIVGRVLPRARTPQWMAACALYSSLVWIQWIWRITGIWEYFLDWWGTVVRSFWGISNMKGIALPQLWLVWLPVFSTIRQPRRGIPQVGLNIS